MASSSVRDAVVDADPPPPVEPEAPRAEHGDAPPPARRRRGWPAVLALTAVIVLPLVVGVIASARPRWFPVLDLAQTELRVRDVGTRHTPLIGLPGRIGDAEHQGSHPGPLSFYALAPVYRLLGSTAWALQVGSVAIHAAAVAAALAIARRRGGTALMAGVGLVLAVLLAGYGSGALSVPWNPYLPLVWWVVVLLATWSVLCRDVALLPVVVLAGSFCAQTHVPYVGLCVGAGAVALAGAVLHFRAADDRGRRLTMRWGLAALVLGVVCWTPPLVDQVIHRPGNLSLLADHFLTPPDDETPQGVPEGAGAVAQRLDGPHFVVDHFAEPGPLVEERDGGRRESTTRGVITVAVWAVAVGLAWRLKDRALLRLHTVIGVAIALGVLVSARIFGKVWYYLLIWAWGIVALLFVALGWTAAVAIGRRLTPDRRARAARAGVGAMLVITAVVAVRFAISAPREEPPDAPLSAALGRLLPDTAAGLDPDGTYLVGWYDSANLGSQGYGLVNELERRGFDVGVLAGLKGTATFHRNLDPSDATARVTLATGVWIDRWRDVPDAVELAYDDPRTAAEREEFDELRAAVIDELEAAGLAELVPRVDEGLFGLAIDPRIPGSVLDKLTEMLRIGVPVGVFVSSPDAAP